MIHLGCIVLFGGIRISLGLGNLRRIIISEFVWSSFESLDCRDSGTLGILGLLFAPKEH